MENFIGKICPYCKTEITVSDYVKVCPACGIPHHESCWIENKGCTTFGCSEKHYEAQHTNPTAVCAICGTTLGDSQAFCPKCGTPKAAAPQAAAPKKYFCAKCGNQLEEGQGFCPKCGTPRAAAPKKVFCGKCGTELQEGQVFCPKCGQKSGLALDANVSSAINQFNANVQNAKAKKSKTPLIIGIVAAALVLIIAVVALGGGSRLDLNDMYDRYCNGAYWATVSSDGGFLSIDDNPYDLDDYYIEEADDAIKSINLALGFTDSLWHKMCDTSANDGKQTYSNDKVTVSWKYHPDRGLSVTYEVKD